VPDVCPSCGRPIRATAGYASTSRCVDRFEVGDRVVTVALTGDLDLDVVGEVREALYDACDSGRHVVLDLERVTLIDSTGLGALVRAHQHAKRNGRMLCLVRPSRFVVTVLHTMRLIRIFPSFIDHAGVSAWLDEHDAIDVAA
jgi:anti-sigma B factor antagonist